MQDAQIGLYDMVLSTTLESNKSHEIIPQMASKENCDTTVESARL